MLNRFKTALYNVVGNFDPTDGGSINNLGTVSLSTGVQNIPSVIRQNSIQGKEKVRFNTHFPNVLFVSSNAFSFVCLLFYFVSALHIYSFIRCV